MHGQSVDGRHMHAAPAWDLPRQASLRVAGPCLEWVLPMELHGYMRMHLSLHCPATDRSLCVSSDGAGMQHG